jgi:hypothetical protein
MRTTERCNRIVELIDRVLAGIATKPNLTPALIRVPVEPVRGGRGGKKRGELVMTRVGWLQTTRHVSVWIDGHKVYVTTRRFAPIYTAERAA